MASDSLVNTRMFTPARWAVFSLARVMRAMIASGLEAHIATVDMKKLPAEFAGREFDESDRSGSPRTVVVSLGSNDGGDPRRRRSLRW